MPKFTVREFCVAFGLEQDGTDYIGAITLLKTLVKHGVAKEVGKVNATRLGRKSIVYELPDPIVLPIPQTVSVPAALPTPKKKKAKVKQEVEQVVEEEVAEEETPEPVVEVQPVVEEEETPEPVAEVQPVEEEPVAAGNCSYDFGDEDDD